MDNLIRVGVSSCLLGNPVRYDGGHKHDRYISEILGRYFTFLPVCPEVECGLPVPRETLRLVGDPLAPRLITSRSGIDHTSTMQQYCLRRVEQLTTENICAFIFKKDSPSSGLHRVKVYNSGGQAQKQGRGLFAAAVTEHFPLLPVEEEGRLHDPDLRENFIERIFANKRWKDFTAGEANYRSLVHFHTQHKLQLMAHSQKHLTALGRLTAGGKDREPGQLLEEYRTAFLQALTLKATVKKNVNVLHHCMGHCKKLLTADEKSELLELIDRYARRIIPLVVPLTLINHYVRKFKLTNLENQTYLEPHPAELMLRNHV